MDKELLNKLKEKYPVKEIELLSTYLDQIPGSGADKRRELLEYAQGIVNELYALEANDALIDVQILINNYRNEYDITDPREIVNIDNGKGFVQ